MSSVMQPHIFKKGKILTFKKLNEGIDATNRKYIFSGLNCNLTTAVHSLNNINQITARCLLGLYKLLSYFGLSKDPSDEFSKGPSTFNKLPHIFRGGGDKIDEMLACFNQQIAKIERLEAKIDQLIIEKASSKEEVVNFTSKIKEIEEYLRKILG